MAKVQCPRTCALLLLCCWCVLLLPSTYCCSHRHARALARWPLEATGCAQPRLRVHRPACGLTHLLLDAPLRLPTLARPPAACTCCSCATAAGCCYLAAATLLPSLVLAVAAAPRCCCFLLLPLLADAPSCWLLLLMALAEAMAEHKLCALCVHNHHWPALAN